MMDIGVKILLTGLVILVPALIAAWLAPKDDSEPEAVKVIGGFALVLGVILIIVGFFLWIWL